MRRPIGKRALPFGDYRQRRYSVEGKELLRRTGRDLTSLGRDGSIRGKYGRPARQEKYRINREVALGRLDSFRRLRS